MSIVAEVEQAFSASNLEFARAYYLFATAKLSDTYDSAAIYQRYPLLTAEDTFLQLKAQYDQNPSDETIRRLFVSTLGTYIGNQLAALSDEIENRKHTLKIDTTGLPVGADHLLYEDVPEWMKKLSAKPDRDTLYTRMGQAHAETVAPLFLDHLRQEVALLARLGYPDLIRFYSDANGHDLPALGQSAARLLAETQAIYTPRMADLYTRRTGLPFDQATRSDIAFVLNTSPPDLADAFPESKLLGAARQTFDGLGLQFSDVAQEADFADMASYEATVNAGNGHPRILLDVAKREGKRSRAYVYPAKVPNEVYLSVKPEGGLDDYSAFFHESGHALHFAYEAPDLGFAQALLGNNSVTEAYAYLFQNLLMNLVWLTQVVGLSEAQAKSAVAHRVLEDVYMLRRYCGKLQFELQLFDGRGLHDAALEDKAAFYGQMLSEATGFAYDTGGWVRDVDAGFYVADYFTAWTLEAQLRQVLMDRFGGDPWVLNPEAGVFLRGLWAKGNLNPGELSAALGFESPNDVGPLIGHLQRLLTA
jgi:hypothetical protein